MTDTYRIKPLVWESAGVGGPGLNDECCRATPYFIYVSSDHTLGAWIFWYEITLSDEECRGERVVVRHGLFKSIDAAKIAAESAYQELIKSALEPA